MNRKFNMFVTIIAVVLLCGAAMFGLCLSHADEHDCCADNGTGDCAITNCACCALVVVLPTQSAAQPPVAGVTHQTGDHLLALPDVLASIFQPPRA